MKRNYSLTGIPKKTLLVAAGEDSFSLSYDDKGATVKLIGRMNDRPVIEISKLNIKSITNSPIEETKVKSYFFSTPFSFEDTPLRFLQLVSGCNLYNVLNALPDLKAEILEALPEYRLRLSFDNASKQVKFWKELSGGEVFIVPFNSISDTLQRMIFYKSAIASNENSIITFEEPEANSYPPYIFRITTDILYSSSNQFFITTHSPYVVNDFLEQGRANLAIFLVDYQEGQTIVRRLKDSDLDEVYENGVDLFFNNQIFQHE